MQITFTVIAEVEHLTGKFVSKDDLAEELKAELEGANPGTLTVDDSEYEVVDLSVDV